MLMLAPLQGFTDHIFRNVYSQNYSGIDVAVSPFISLTDGTKGYLRLANDVLPEKNNNLPVIPQILSNKATQVIEMAKVLYDLGYHQINFNMGCPVKNTARKKRGAGLLPYPEIARIMLEEIMNGIPQKLSVKIRLGLQSPNEVFNIITVLNGLPLDYIILHPRTANQMYEGRIDYSFLKKILPSIKHKTVYNGDIFSIKDHNNLQDNFPDIQDVMIGRGIFYNPFLPMLIKGNKIPDGEESRIIFSKFTNELYHAIRESRAHQKACGKIKDLWKFFCMYFIDHESVYQRITRCSSYVELKETTSRILEIEQMKAS